MTEIRVILGTDFLLKYTLGLARGLLNVGADLRILTRDHDLEFGKEPGAMTRSVEASLAGRGEHLVLSGRVREPRHWREALALRRRTGRFGADVFHLQDVVVNDPGLVAAAVHSWKKLAVTVHDPVAREEDDENSVGDRRSREFLLKRARLVFVHAEVLREQLIESTGLKAPVVVVPHGIDPPDVSPIPDRPRVLMFGRMHGYKGVDILLDAMGLIWEERPEVELTIAGQGPLPNHPLLDDARVEVRNHHIHEDTGAPDRDPTPPSTVDGRAASRAAWTAAAALPSDTSLRYAILVSTVLASTSAIYMRLWLDRYGTGSGYQRCVEQFEMSAADSIRPGAGDAWIPRMADAMACIRPDATWAMRYALVGVGAVIVLATATYFAMPWWRIRRNRLVRLDRGTGIPLIGYLDELVDRVGLARRPTFWVAPNRPHAQGLAFGRQRRCHVQLNDGLLEGYALAGRRPEFDAVVLHELSHIRNRDIGYTYRTVAIWRAFLLVALAPYTVLQLVPLPLGRTVSGHVVLSIAALVGLVYLTYASILRARETHADLGSALTGEPGALARVLRRAPGGRRWNPLARHLPTKQRLAMLDNPARATRTRLPVVVGAGIAIAILQANLSIILVQLLVVQSPGPLETSKLYPQIAAVTNAGSAVMLAGLAAVLAWQTHLRDQPLPERQPFWRRIGLPVLALAAGLLIGEPLSVFSGVNGAWGVFDPATSGGLAAVAVSVVSLALLLALLFAWMDECAAAWVPVVRRWLRGTVAAAALVGAAALYPAYSAWAGFHYSPAILSVHAYYAEYMPTWQATWRPPAYDLVMSAYLPLVVVHLVPGVALLLAAPVVMVVYGLVRRVPAEVPRWRRLAGFDAVAPPAARPRPPLGDALRAGLLAAVPALAAAVALAELVRARGGPATATNIPAAGGYLVLATTYLGVLAATGAALVVAARVDPARGTLAVLAALVTMGATALASPVPIVLGICGTAQAAACLPAMPLSVGATVYFGVAEAVAGAAAVAGLAAAVARLANRRRGRTRDTATEPAGYPSRVGQAVVASLGAVLLAVLAVGGYLGYHLLV